MIRVTCWQWVMELALTILASFLHIIKGKNRAIEHGMTLFVAGFSYVILPAFYLMADQQFRNNLEKSGLYKAIINAFKQNQDRNDTQAIVTPGFNLSKLLIQKETKQPTVNNQQQNSNVLSTPIFLECHTAPAPCPKKGVPLPLRSL